MAHKNFLRSFKILKQVNTKNLLHTIEKKAVHVQGLHAKNEQESHTYVKSKNKFTMDKRGFTGVRYDSGKIIIFQISRNVSVKS